MYAESAAAGEGSSTAPIFAPRPTLTDDNHHHGGDDDESSLMTNYQMTIAINDDNDHDVDNSIISVLQTLHGGDLRGKGGQYLRFAIEIQKIPSLLQMWIWVEFYKYPHPSPKLKLRAPHL